MVLVCSVLLVLIHSTGLIMNIYSMTSFIHEGRDVQGVVLIPILFISFHEGRHVRRDVMLAPIFSMNSFMSM